MVLYTEKSTETFQMQFSKSDIDKDGMYSFKLGNISTVPTQRFFLKISQVLGDIEYVHRVWRSSILTLDLSVYYLTLYLSSKGRLFQFGQYLLPVNDQLRLTNTGGEQSQTRVNVQFPSY